VIGAIPRLYPILDAGLLAHAGISVEDFARGLRDAGIRFLQHRDKDSSDRQVLDRAALLRSIFPASDSTLILNDRVDLCRIVGFDGVHLGQEDMSPADARNLLGPDALIGLSTHNPDQILDPRTTEADYIALGPVYATSSKQNPDPVIGLEGVRGAHNLTKKPMVAIGGITQKNCLAVLGAGAYSVAVISALLPVEGKSVRNLAEEFLLLMQNTE
jgi:thiamine-phosphate pyrophosphorylase